MRPVPERKQIVFCWVGGRVINEHKKECVYMAVSVKLGEVYPCKDLKSGNSQKGAWALFSVKAQKGYDRIKVFASNPEDVKNAQAVRIKSIDMVEIKAHLDERSDKWLKDYQITATLERAAAAEDGGNFVPAKAEDGDDPFNMFF